MESPSHDQRETNLNNHEMRVLQVIADGAPGGGSTHLLQVLSSLTAEFEFVLATQPASYLMDESLRLGVRTFGVDLFEPSSMVRANRLLDRVIDDVAPDLIHVHGGRAAFFCSMVGGNTPCIYTVHGYHFLHGNVLLRKLRVEIERRVSRRYDTVVFVSNHDQLSARKYGLLSSGQRSVVIHNGIALVGGKMNAPPHRRMGFVGRLEHPKDPLLFMAVASRLRDHAAVVVGDGTLSSRVRAERDIGHMTHVELLGEKSHERVQELLRGLSVLVITSRWEGLPLIALEAMAAGVPVVATKVGGLPEVIEDGKSGLLVDSRDPKVIAAAVRRVLDDDRLRESIISSGRERVRELFSEQRMISQLSALYREALSVRQATPRSSPGSIMPPQSP